MNQADVIHQLINLAGYLWIALVVIWVIGALKTKTTVWRQSAKSRMIQTGIVLIGAYLLFGKINPIPRLDAQIIPLTESVAFLGLAFVLCGVAFSVWARLTIGANWSGVITLKEHHALIRSGPYRLVRHPIYTGILLALFGSALQRGLVRSLLGVVSCAAGFWLKARTEEGLMVQHFGESYLRFRREVKMLIPFLF